MSKLMIMGSPELSVVMSVYNGEEYLAASIESILDQTYKDFEFIIIDDGSTDSSPEIIRHYSNGDKRVLAVHQENKGLTPSLNRGVGMAQGDYIARQDADDISLPGRLEAQMAFLKQNEKVVLCGTWFEEVNEDKGKKIRRYPLEDTILRKNLKYVNQFCHPSVIFKKQAFFQAGQYDEQFQSGQDFELWIRLAGQGEIANLPEVLVRRRIGFDNTISWGKKHLRREMISMIIDKHFDSKKDVNIIKYLKFYFPLIIYPYIPLTLLKIIRAIRYR